VFLFLLEDISMKLIKNVFFHLIVLIILMFAIKITGNLSFYPLKQFAEVLFRLYVLVVTTKLFVVYGVRSIKLNNFTRNFSVVLYSILLVFILLDVAFIFIPLSNVSGRSKASEIWFKYYWNPKNELGYRDRTISDEKNKRKILILGDSITAGHGIKNARDRYTDQLQKKIGDRYRIYNLGMNGSDTEDEYQRLLSYPVKPDILVLQYFGNDIERVAIRTGATHKSLAGPYGDINWLTKWALRHSYFLDFIFWQIPRKDMGYWEYLEAAYTNREILELHLQDLNKIVVYAQSHNVPLVVIMFPFLKISLDKSKFYIEPVSDFLKRNHIRVEDVSGWVSNVRVDKRMVNKTDGHPSVLVHEIIADHLFAIINDLSLSN
jgi:hypothetical protein